MTLTRENALAQARAMKASQHQRIESLDGQIYAQCSLRKTDEWTIRRVGDNNSHRGSTSAGTGKAFARLTTRNKNVVAAVLETLAEFHRRDAL